MKQIILDLNKKIKQRVEITEDTEIIGWYFGCGNEKLKSEIEIIHNKPRLKSLTAVKAVLFDQSKFDATGNLVINKGAKFTDAYLRIDALMISPNAFARVVPSLEIFENDVKGGHGATVGEVDREQLFYLQSRGLNLYQAEELIILGFMTEILEKIRDKKLKTAIIDTLAVK